MLTPHFFDAVRADLFGGRLTEGQVTGLEAIESGFARDGRAGGANALAYVLATAYHETGRRMVALRETGADSDALAVARLDRAYASGRLRQVKTPYWRADAEGKCWFGRGLVQITHKANYERLGRAIGVDLVGDPSRALEPDVAVKVLVIGMRDGLFTGRRLSHCFHEGVTDWIGARAIVNGRDRAELIADHARVFQRALGVG